MSVDVTAAGIIGESEEFVIKPVPLAIVRDWGDNHDGTKEVQFKPYLPPDLVDEDKGSICSSSSSSCSSEEDSKDTWDEIEEAKATNVVTSIGDSALIHVISDNDDEEDTKVATLCNARPRRARNDRILKEICQSCTAKVWSADVVKLFDK